jgi:hypothetical protein
MKVVSFTLEQGNKYFGRVDGGPKFFIGRRVSFEGNKGLMNVAGTPAEKYDRTQFSATHGFWASFIHPTAIAEGALFHTLNTYDRARFTFTFLQYAAHVPDGDFVVYLRSLLLLPLAAEYFPDLVLEDGHICKVTGSGATQPIESSSSTDGLMDYFNPSSGEVEDTEVIQAARLIHWSQNDPDHRKLQVTTGIAHFKEKMPLYVRRYPMLDGADPRICTVVADIHHQGRAKVSTVLMALQSSDPLTALLKIGEDQFGERISTLRREIKALATAGVYANLKYDKASNDFIQA